MKSFPNIHQMYHDGEIDEGEFRILEWQYRMSGDFHAALFSAIARADTMNLERLARGFPAECGAFVAYREVKDWWPNLQRKVGIEAGT